MRPNLIGKLMLAAALMGIVPASAAVRVYRPWGWGYGWSYWNDPFYYGYGPAYHPNQGEVKLDTKVKDAQVFINGAYAGTTKEDKTMHLRPGSYKIEIREGERTAFSQEVYVAAGKTIHLHPEL